MINLLCYLCNTSQQNLASSTFNFIWSSMNQAAHKNYIQPDEHLQMEKLLGVYSQFFLVLSKVSLTLITYAQLVINILYVKYVKCF